MQIVTRPWGWYQTVSEAPGYLVKRIGVSPGQQLSLQRHRMRAEHWLVVRGMARVTVGDRVQDMTVGEHVDIALGEVHRLANRTDEAMEIVEVQLGAQLDEDDIERLQDDYGRH
ncbi:MAG: phosphomannose isomerase type II C-terminal cupin domain [Burkholderiaceae bacterium]